MFAPLHSRDPKAAKQLMIRLIKLFDGDLSRVALALGTRRDPVVVWCRKLGLVELSENYLRNKLVPSEIVAAKLAFELSSRNG